jgi:hypothetical protein
LQNAQKINSSQSLGDLNLHKLRLEAMD